MTRTARRSVPHRAPALAVVVAAVAVLLAVLAGGSAAAHAVLLGTDPEDGTVLDAPPDDLTITFNEPVRAVESGTTVLAADGTEVAVDVAARDAALVVTPAEPLADGTYVVSWRVVSLDSHPVAGAFSFSVGAPSATTGGPGPAAASAEPSGGLEVVRVVDQTAVYLGTFLVAGLVVFELLVLHATPGAMPRLRARLHRARTLGLGVGLAGLVLSVPLTTAWQAGRGPDALLDGSSWAEGLASDTGLAAALGVVGLVGAAFLAPRAARESRALWPAGVALGASTLALGALVLAGHTRTFGPAALVVAADVLHVVAGAVWLGGVVGLVLVLVASSQVDDKRAATTVARFSALGGWVVLALSLTGVVLGWRILGSVDALVSTSYGQALLVKAGVALVVVAIAAWNRYRLVPSFAARAARRTTSVVGVGADAEVSRRLGRTVAAEAGLLVVVLAVTGLLVSRSPVDAAEQSGSPPGSDVAAPTGVDVTRPLGDGTLRARVTPGAVGVNALELELLDADGAPLEPVDAPELSTTLAEPALGPFTRPVTRTGPGTYEATLDLPMPGSWTVSVSVRTSKYENPVVEIPVEVTS
ncbi:copper resistance protein CopC [Cellulosimicrobium sp. NPDC057127]|uniref:copper resistance CopC/CopD family protein n=1 Tax=Cellulosimicrobium sp. NPDC057127 TaxID=3346026 RepID=UPI00363C5E1E